MSSSYEKLVKRREACRLAQQKYRKKHGKDYAKYHREMENKYRQFKNATNELLNLAWNVSEIF